MGILEAYDKDGTPVITSVSESPGIVNELDQAAAGLQLIVKDGGESSVIRASLSGYLKPSSVTFAAPPHTKKLKYR